MNKQKPILKNVDNTLIILYLALSLIGWISIYAAVFDKSHSSILDLTQAYGKQAIWIGTAFIWILLIMLTDAKFFNAFALPIYIVTLTLLLLVLFLGKEVSGSKSWFEIGSFALQPAEFAKVATALALAHFMSGLNFDSKKLKHKILSLVIILIPSGLVLLQNDTGSAIVYSSLVFVLYRKGMPDIYLIGAGAVILISVLTLLINNWIVIGAIAFVLIILSFYIRKTTKNIITLIAVFAVSTVFVLSVDYIFDNLLEPHQKTRINILLGKEIDLKGAGYNVNQSKIAIGSGGFLGKGFLKGTQTKYDFVPEQSTDFIFCTIGEEWGFVGTTVVIVLFMWLIIRILLMAERQRSEFSKLYGYSVASILFFHFMVNIGMTIGLIPVVGIPLPFMSYGGSSMWAFTILLFIFIKLDSNRLYYS